MTDFMTYILKNSIKRLPCVNSGGLPNEEVVIQVKKMSWHDVNLWYTLAQPLINKNFQHCTNALSAQDARADVGWDWSLNFSLVLLHNTASYVPGNKSGPAHALTIAVTTVEGVQIPIGMLTVVPRFFCHVEGVKQDRTFVWYLADAPRAFYTDVLCVAPVKGVATALLDSAVQAGIVSGGDGSTLLHADPKGGQKLTDFYVNRCSMRQVSVQNGPLSFLRRRHSDQYYFMDAMGAQRFCAQFDRHR